MKKLIALFLAVFSIASVACMNIAAADEGATALDSTTISENTTPSSDGVVTSECELSYVVSSASANTYSVRIPKKVLFTTKTPKVTVSGSASLEAGKAVFVYLDGDSGNLSSGSNTIPYSVNVTTGDGSAISNSSKAAADWLWVGKLTESKPSFTNTLGFTLTPADDTPAGTYTKTISFKTWIE